MSWVVGQYIRDMAFLKEITDINSDVYNNALLVEQVVEKLVKENLITEFEKEVLWAIGAGYSYSEAARILGSHRLTISDTFNRLTDRIAFILGGDFTDSGFLERVQTMGSLYDTDMEQMFKRGPMKVDTDG